MGVPIAVPDAPSGITAMADNPAARPRSTQGSEPTAPCRYSPSARTASNGRTAR